MAEARMRAVAQVVMQKASAAVLTLQGVLSIEVEI